MSTPLKEQEKGPQHTTKQGGLVQPCNNPLGGSSCQQERRDRERGIRHHRTSSRTNLKSLQTCRCFKGATSQYSWHMRHPFQTNDPSTAQRRINPVGAGRSASRSRSLGISATPEFSGRANEIVVLENLPNPKTPPWHIFRTILVLIVSCL